MSTIHRLPDAAGAEREAGEWVARLHADDVTTEDMARFEAWRSAHPRHARAYEEMSGTIDMIKHTGRLVRAVSFGNAMQAAGAATPARKFSRVGLAVAATVLVAIAAVWWLQRAGSQTLFQTAVGERASVELPDGSRLELDSDSVARVQYSEESRTIRLARGEAFFQVAHEPGRPFWVVAGSSWIRAVGTAFKVDLQPAGVHVTVSEGTVKVATARGGEESPSDAVLAQGAVSVLVAGQQAQVQSGAAQIRSVTSLERARLDAWRKGKLYFENQPLQSVLDELGRYSTARIVVEDEALGSLPIGGTFQADAQGMGALLGMLREGFGLSVRRERGGSIHISGEWMEKKDSTPPGDSAF